MTAGLTAASVMAWPHTHALMAGMAPDSPLRRLDDNRTESLYACVAAITTGGGVYSAVCIASRFVLTAAHVAREAAQLTVYLNLGRDLSHRYGVVRVVRHPGFTHFNAAFPVNDLALLELDAPLPETLGLPAWAHHAVQPGARIELVGHGASGNGDRGADVAAHPALRRTGANRIERLLPDGDAPLLYDFVFDRPTAATAGTPAEKSQRGSLGNLLETGLASGDSGSPAFVMQNDRPALFGINTFVMRPPTPGAAPSTFGAGAGGQVLQAHRSWLASVIGHEPGAT